MIQPKITTSSELNVINVDLNTLDEGEIRKRSHSIHSALFNLNHIFQMIENGRRIEDFTPEILASFAKAKEVVEFHLETVSQIYNAAKKSNP